MMYKPILFNEDMITAILRGGKTQTRRVVKPQPPENCDMCLFDINGKGWFYEDKEDGGEFYPEDARMLRCPYGKPGDLLWVREKFAIECPYGPASGCNNPDHVIYWQGEEPSVRDSITAKWRPSIFMPRWASRITLKVLSVRMERVKDISEGGAIAEGVKRVKGNNWLCYQYPERGYRSSATASFMSLWDSINKKRGYGWDQNPWVWVVEFEKVKNV